MIFTPNDNVRVVASFDGQTVKMSQSQYEAELREYEQSREYRELNSLMRERSAVRL
jgi:hypothetical protein